MPWHRIAQAGSCPSVIVRQFSLSFRILSALMSRGASTIGADQSVEDLGRELSEARQREAATAEILKVISSSPTDLERVFAEIAASAARLCDAHDASIRQVDGEVLRLVAHHGPIPISGTLRLSHGTLNA